MGLLSEVFNPRPAANGWSPSSPPTHDGWYVRDISGYVAEAAGGVSISAESIMRCSTVLAAVRFRGDSWAMCPPSTFIKTSKGREEDPTHYSQVVLRHPNAWQTGNRWRHVNGVWMATWGNAYSEIKSGRTSFVDQLWPMHPSRVRIVDQRADGSLLYEYRRPEGGADLLGQEKVLHFRDISTDGMSGLPMYQLIRNVAGIAMLVERHEATFLRKGTRISGLLVPAQVLSDTQRQELAESVNAQMGGASATGMLGILPHGVDIKPLTLSTKDSQVLELDENTTRKILQFLGVPGVVVGFADKTATYASAEAFFEKGGIKHCILPILTNVEAEEEKALLTRGDGRQIKHNLDALERANTKDRIESLVKSVGGPIRTINEARAIEDMNRLEDPRYDEVMIPVNMTGAVDPEAAPEPEEPPARRRVPPPSDDESARLPAPPSQVASRAVELARGLARDAAAAILAFEASKVRALAVRHARDKAQYRAAVLELYGSHSEHVAKKMRISDAAARSYCDSQAAAVLANGLAGLEQFDDKVVTQLAEMALEG